MTARLPLVGDRQYGVDRSKSFSLKVWCCWDLQRLPLVGGEQHPPIQLNTLDT